MTDGYHPKTSQCWQCGATESRDVMLEVCVWVKADGTQMIHPKRRCQCVDSEACDIRARENAMKARILGDGPVKVRL